MILQVTLVLTDHIVDQAVIAQMLIQSLQNKTLEHVKHVAEEAISCAMGRKKLVFVAEVERLYLSLKKSDNKKGAITALVAPSAFNMKESSLRL